MDKASINAQIAERIFGWKAWQSKHGYWYLNDAEGNRLEVIEVGPEYDSATGKKRDRSRWWEFSESLPDFCGDPDASKRLRNRLAELGYTVEMKQWKSSGGEMFHNCTLLRELAPIAYSNLQESMEEAVSLCALKCAEMGK